MAISVTILSDDPVTFAAQPTTDDHAPSPRQSRELARRRRQWREARKLQPRLKGTRATRFAARTRAVADNEFRPASLSEILTLKLEQDADEALCRCPKST